MGFAATNTDIGKGDTARMAPEQGQPKGKAKGKSYNFASLRRPEKSGIAAEALPKWHLNASYKVFHHPVPQLSPADRKSNYQTLRATGYPKGIQLPKLFQSSLGDTPLLAYYNAFDTAASYTSYVDVVCPDIFGPVAGKPDPQNLEGLDKEFYSFITPLRTKFSELGTYSDTKYSVPSPLEVVRAYADDAAVREVVDRVVRLTPCPVLIPLLNQDVWPEYDTNNNPKEVARIPFILVHAVQLLLFAPTDWDERRTYSRSREAYEHRYPLDNGPTAVAGLFSMEDLNRSVLTVYALFNRRNGRGDAMQARPPGTPAAFTWCGYVDPAYDPTSEPPEGLDRLHDQEAAAQSRLARAQMGELQQRMDAEGVAPLKGLDVVDACEPILEHFGSHDLPKKLASKYQKEGAGPVPRMSDETHREIILELKMLHGIQDPEERLARIKQTVTGVEEHVAEADLNTYISTVSPQENIQRYAEKYPGKLDGLLAELRRQMALEHFMSSLQPEKNVDLNAVCDKLGLTRWPDVRLYKQGGMESYKPHQVLDAASILERSESEAPHVFFSNEMGTGKTRTYLLAIALASRQLEKHKNEGNDAEYLPSMVVTPPSSLVQCYLEAKANFLDFNLVIFWGSQSTFVDQKAKVLSTGEFSEFVSSLDRSSPRTARTIILTTYPTLATRLLKTSYKFFQFTNKSAQDAANKEPALEDEPTQPGEDGEQVEQANVSGPVRQRKVRRYAEDQVSRDAIRFCEDADGADGNLVVHTSALTDSSRVQFRFLVADEAQLAKRADGTYNRVFGILKWRSLLWVSGTPLSSSLRDLLSPLLLMWKALSVTWEPAVDTLGWLPGLYRPDYDPVKTTNAFAGSDSPTTGIFSPEFLAQHPELEVLKAAFDKDGSRLWILHPHLYKTVGQRLTWGGDLASQVVRPILSKMQIRRTMLSPVTLPDGSVTYPGEGILPATIHVEELEFRRGTSRQRFEESGKKLAGELFSKISSVSAEKELTSDAEANMNVGVHRLGVLTTFDNRNHIVLQATKPLLAGKRDDVINKVRQMGEQKTQSAPKRLQGPVVGVEHVEDLVRHDTNGGLTFLYTVTNTNPDLYAPTTSSSLIRWLAAESPIMTRALDLAFQHVRGDKKRLLFYVDMPWIQAVVVAMFTIAGYNVLTIRSSDKPAHRNRVLNEWNDTDAHCDIFVANINIMATGVNMHQACSIGVFLCWHLNFKVNLQAMGRLIRIGQKEAVRWHLLKVKNSYHDCIERLSLSKWASQLSAEIGLPDWMQGAIREVCVWETIKTFLHQEFNRYAWMIERDMGEEELVYHGELTIKLSHVFSIVAKLLIRSNSEDQEFWCQSREYLVAGLIHLAKETKPNEDWESCLDWTAEDLRDKFLGDIKQAFSTVKEAIEKESDERLAAMQSRLTRNAKDRDKPKSVEIIDDEADEGAEEEEEEEEEEEGGAETVTVGESSVNATKRKAKDSGDGQSDAKRQKD
ncbi:hypothetical protein FDECE_4132 [Fusarium decemcellulare]|nr:hypothetical protein FDECE_4132 [Fusarium decemcellulare]